MYIEELYELINELNLSKMEQKQICMITKIASRMYLSALEEGKINEYFKFIIPNEYIQQTDFLNNLGIKVFPTEWQEKKYKTSIPNTSPTYYKTYTITKRKTEVIFPTKIYTKEKKNDIFQKVRRKNNCSK